MPVFSAEPPFVEGSVLAGKLRVVRLLGMGGMGAVYEVEHVITCHRRALKLLHASMVGNASVVERFLREASAAGRIGNPHIVETFDAGYLETGEPYIVMELLRGRTLATLLGESGPLEVVTACDLLIQACDGIGAAHAAGIIHRDLKPENLFLTDPEGKFVKILDFGISKFDVFATGVEALTVEGAPMGTPCYMSPEQVKGLKTVDARTDVYALGVLLYECLTGRKPFEADSLAQLAYLITQAQFTPPSDLRPSLPKVLDRIVAKAMSDDRAQRYETAQCLSLELARLRQSLVPTAGHTTSSNSAVSPLDSQRDAPALTPDAFSQSASRLSTFRVPRRRWLGPGLGIVGLGIIALGVVLTQRNPSRPMHHDQTFELSTTTYPAVATAQPSTASVIIAPRAASTSAPKPSSSRQLAAPQLATSMPGTSQANWTRPRDRAPAPSTVSEVVLAPVVPQPVAAHSGTEPDRKPPKNRAHSYGLTEKNPFE